MERAQWCLLVRRNRSTVELAFYRCSSPRPVPMCELVRVAGRRWTVEETFQASRGLTGLDEHQVRRWTSWHRWVTLAMLAHAFLAVTAATERRDRPVRDNLIPLTGNEIRHLFAALISPVHDLAYRLRWSHWRRRHQARARQCHTEGKRPHSRDDQDLRLEYQYSSSRSLCALIWGLSAAGARRESVGCFQDLDSLMWYGVFR